jgi:hypothetical protein
MKQPHFMNGRFKKFPKRHQLFIFNPTIQLKLETHPKKSAITNQMTKQLKQHSLSVKRQSNNKNINKKRQIKKKNKIQKP